MTGLLVELGKRNGDLQAKSELFDVFQRIAISFPLCDPQKPCHPEAQRRIP